VAGRKVNADSPTGQVFKGSSLTINTCGRWVPGSAKELSVGQLSRDR